MEARVYIASPCYGGLLHADMADMRTHECVDLTQAGIGFKLDTTQRGCWLPRNRNKLAKAAKEANATHLFFWDADVFPLANGYIRRLLETGHDVVAGVYPTRHPDGALAWQVVDGHEGVGEFTVREERGCVEVVHVGTGFMLIALGALERVKTACVHYPAVDEWGFFDFGEKDGAPVLDDYSFCDRWRSVGGKVWAEPTMRFGHVGTHNFTGAVAQ